MVIYPTVRFMCVWVGGGGGGGGGRGTHAVHVNNTLQTLVGHLNLT